MRSHPITDASTTNRNITFVLFNTLFFGIVGSYIGGLIYVLIWIKLTSSYHQSFYYFFLSPLVGFIPAAFTGFLYSITYIKFKGVGIKIALLYGFFGMMALGAFMSFTQPDYTYDINYKQSIDIISAIKFTSSLALLGAFCALACSKLVNKIYKY